VKGSPATHLRAWLGLPIPIDQAWHCGGHSLAVHLPLYHYMADHPIYPRFSFLVVYEDGSPLPHPHSSHADIRSLGHGRYVHWQEHLVFSATDNTDPLTNKRSYQFSTAWWLYRKHYRRWPIDSGDGAILVHPSNYLILDSRDEAIARDSAYALAVAERYLEHIAGGPVALDGATVLEIGPGTNLGTSLVLSCMGASCSVSDRFPTQWDSYYHPKLYRALRDLLQQRRPGLDLTPIDTVLDAGLTDPVIPCHDCSVESLDGVADGSVDIVLSNAVLEHCFDLPRAVDEMARVTKPGGLGLHQVDHRDHRDRSRPLDYLLLTEEEFEVLFQSRQGECGNRYRPCQLRDLYIEKGFSVLELDIQERAEQRYLDDVMKRLRLDRRLTYGSLEREQISELGCFYKVFKR
jgi:SAM-dependent methyltransferase